MIIPPNRTFFLLLALATAALLILSPTAAESTDIEIEDQINIYLQSGNDALSAGDLPIAIQQYELCLNLDPNQRYCLINYASSIVELNESNTNDTVETKLERVTKAQSLLRQVLSVDPNDGDASFNLALLLQESSRSEEITREAAALYQIAVEASIRDGLERWDAWANLAAARQEMGQILGPFGAHKAYERSIVPIERIVDEHQSYIDSVLNDPDAGKREWDEQRYIREQAEILSLNVYLSKLYYGLGTILSELSPEDCLNLMSQENLLFDRENGKDEQSAKTVCHVNAVNALRKAVDYDGNNVVAEHMLDAMIADTDYEDVSSMDSKSKASNEFVSALFDDFANTFDEKLGALGYVVPQLVGEAAFWILKQTERDTYHSVLDAGCGTGLAGRFLRPLVGGSLVGVDLSTKMLEVAAQCTMMKGCGLKEDIENLVNKEDTDQDERSSSKLYDHLISLDLETATLKEIYSGQKPLQEVDVGFDLIVAADVLVYFGDIEKLLTNFANLSTKSDPEGYLIFSCERIEEGETKSGWKLQTSGRYAHSKSYIVGVAKKAGFRLAGYEEIVPRMEKGEEVKGHLFQFAYGEDTTWTENMEEMVFMDYIDAKKEDFRDEL